MGGSDAGTSDGADCIVFRDRAGELDHFLFIDIGSLCEVFYGSGLFDHSLAFFMDRFEDNGDLPVDRISGGVFYFQKQ